VLDVAAVPELPDDELPPAASATPPPVSNASTAAAVAKVVRLNTLGLLAGQWTRVNAWPTGYDSHRIRPA
jgi:hypothetical protein